LRLTAALIRPLPERTHRLPDMPEPALLALTRMVDAAAAGFPHRDCHGPEQLAAGH
jgi:hypothetical protein